MIARRILSGVGANIFDKLVIAGTQLAMVPILANAWGLHLYGLWVLLATAPSFLAMGDFGFATAAGTKMTMAVARGDRQAAIGTFQSAWIAILASSVLLILTALLVALLIPAAWIGDSGGMAVGDVRLTFLFLMLYGIAAIQGSIFFAGFRCAGLFAVGAFWNALILLTENSLVIGAVLRGAHPVLAAAILLCGRVVGIIGQGLLLRRKVGWLPLGFAAATRSEVGSLLAPAGGVMLLPIAQALSLHGTAIALGAAAGQAVVPIFTAARTLSRVGQQMCWLLNTALMPEFSAAAAREDRKAMATMVLVTLATSAILLVPYAIGFALLGRWVVGIWTHGLIHPPHMLMIVMALGSLCGGVWYPISTLILALTRHGTYTTIFLLLSAATIPLTYELAGRVGALGAGFALTALDGLMLLVIAAIVRRELIGGHELRAALTETVAYARAKVQKRQPSRRHPADPDEPPLSADPLP
jgi:O-antigen/teichoic acid export membrane protein